jgi:plastocyanin
MDYDSTDKTAFLAIMGLAALTGVVSYFLFAAATPKVGVVDSIYRQELPPQTETSAASKAPAASEAIDESKFTNKISINILEGASTQGNPNYRPDPAAATSDALITWVNDDSSPHTATSGTGPQDPESGKLFDSGILTSGDKFSIPAEKIGKGEYSYYCTVHPYMLGKITIS